MPQYGGSDEYYVALRGRPSSILSAAFSTTRSGSRQAKYGLAHFVKLPCRVSNDDASVLVDSSWVALSQELPSKIRTKMGLVSSLTYGVVPGAIIAEYPGQHAELQIELAGRSSPSAMSLLRRRPGARKAAS